MDFIEGLPISFEYNVILVMVDRLNKYAHFILVSHPYTASKIVQVFLANVFKLHGMPKSVVSDEDPIFTGAFWKDLFKLHGTKLKFSSTYHPQMDGWTEIINNYLRIKMFFRG